MYVKEVTYSVTCTMTIIQSDLPQRLSCKHIEYPPLNKINKKKKVTVSQMYEEEEIITTKIGFFGLQDYNDQKINMTQLQTSL